MGARHALGRPTKISVLTRVLPALVLVGAFGSPSNASPCARDEVLLRTFWVEVRPEKKTYAPGDKVALNIVVTRPAHEDPAGAGQPIDPPTSAPAENIPVNAGVGIGDYYPYSNVYLTDAEGKARVIVKLPRYVSEGFASIDVMAKAKQLDTFCPDLVEIGFRHLPSAFRVVR